jgi:hypothetical protein
MAMSARSTGMKSKNQTCFAGDSHVKTSRNHQLPKLGLMVNGQDCGLNTKEPFAFFDQESCLWKTLTLFGQMDLDESSETFPYSGTMLNGQLYRHAPWVPHTCDGECSLWPTPTKSMGERGWGISKGTFCGKLRAKASTVQRVLKSGYFPHPELIKVLMGFPIGATELEPLGTP